jgi:signal recognition particle subunit SRP54
LLDADVNFKIAKDFTKVKEKDWSGCIDYASTRTIMKLEDELTELMGGDVAGINLSAHILMSGLQGSGKRLFLENWLIIFDKRTKPLVA